MEKTATYDNLLNLEQQLAKLLGAKAFDYVFLFDRKLKLTVKLEYLSEKSLSLMKIYFDTTNQYLKELAIPEIETGKSLEQDFLLALRTNYVIRYSQAVALYASYNLNRIPTDVEAKILEVVKGQQDITITFYIPDAFILDEFGSVDLEKTRLTEKKDHRIASFLSSVVVAEIQADQMFAELHDNSARQLSFTLFPEELKALANKLIQTCLIFYAQITYTYLEKRFGLNESKMNTISYIRKNFQTDGKDNWRLLGLETQIQKLITDGLDQITELNVETKKELTNEYQKAIINFLKSDNFTLDGFFALDFKELPEIEAAAYRTEVGGIIELYLYLDDGQTAPSPGERYLISLSNEAKSLIFEEVTNGIVNPQFTLDDYLVL